MAAWLWAASIGASAQNPAQATPVPDANATQVPSAQTPTVANPGAQIPAPKETPNNVNTGTGLSLEPYYWLTTLHPSIKQGKNFGQVDPGDFKYPDSAHYAIGAQISVPAGKNAAVRVSYFQAKKSGFVQSVGANRNLFGVEVTKGDALEADYKMEYFKASYEYLTYYWHRGPSEFRVKTLYEFQRVSFANNLFDFSPNGDGTFQLNPATGTHSVNLPTLGLGLEQIVSPHFRWDAKFSGMGKPHGPAIGDAEASIAYRINHFEVLLTERYMRFKTSPQAKDHFSEATIYGPMVSLRYYWKKR